MNFEQQASPQELKADVLDEIGEIHAEIAASCIEIVAKQERIEKLKIEVASYG